jgi:hypothetical protein
MGLCVLRLTLGLVRKSAVSGNSTGEERLRSREEVEGGPAVAGLCMGDARGLRLGDTPGWEKIVLLSLDALMLQSRSWLLLKYSVLCDITLFQNTRNKHKL